MKILYVFDNETEYQDHLARNIVASKTSGGGTPARVSEDAHAVPEEPSLKDPEPVIIQSVQEADPLVIRCQECNTEFQPKSAKSKFCSDPCYQKNYQREYQKKRQDQKLKEICKKDPKPTKRPDIQRQL